LLGKLQRCQNEQKTNRFDHEALYSAAATGMKPTVPLRKVTCR
jgi:hypothetical protein